MRKALYTKLITITEFGNRIYQPYTAPENPTTPYGVIKMMGDDPVLDNRKGSIWSFSVFIYVGPDSFVLLDTLVTSVRSKLHNVTLTTALGEKFRPEYIKTLEDIHDDARNLFSKRVDFDYGGART